MSEEGKPSRPGEAALQNMKLLKTECSVFKVPKVPVEKKPQPKKSKVLDEDVYVEGISKIIQRDFFPDLEMLNAQNEFLEATENKDYTRLREITLKYSGRRPNTEPHMTPATFDTPEVDRPGSPTLDTVRVQQPDADQENKSQSKQKDITDDQTLDAFLAKYTSEDNASYERVTALERRRRAARAAAAAAAEEAAAAAAAAQLRLPSIEEQADQTTRPLEVGTWTYRARNYIMYVPEGAAQAAAARPGLRRGNTRLRADPFDHRRDREAITAIARKQDATVSGKIAVDGTCAGRAPAVFVGTPSPRPGAGPDQSPLMTWGEIEGTPFRLDGGDTPLPAVGAGAAYRMLESGARERIALQLADRAARRRRPATPAAAARLSASPSFRTNTERLAHMSPAARRLATKHLLTPRHRLTPLAVGVHPLTPRSPRTPRTPRTPRGKLVTTPTVKSKPSNDRQLTDAVKNSLTLTEQQTLTDNLLQISVAKRERLKAKDFFVDNSKVDE